MKYKMFITTLIYLYFCLNYIVCHLKDLGEKRLMKNWTNHVLNDIEQKVVGGDQATLRQFPFNVQFFNLGSLCGGSILTRKTVLTAAHCLDHNKNIAEMLVVSNPRFVFDLHADSHEVWDFKIHERYNEATLFSADLAILIIHDDFQFSDHVQKVMLGTTFMWMKEGEIFTATGWGETEYGKPVTNNTLSKVELNFVPLDKCMEWNHITLTSEMFCLYGDGVRDTCRGDSGGGILWKGVLIGITSHGRGCGQVPGVYINVCKFNPWITDTVETLLHRYCQFHVD